MILDRAEGRWQSQPSACTHVGRALQTEGTARANAPRQKHAQLFEEKQGDHLNWKTVNHESGGFGEEVSADIKEPHVLGLVTPWLHYLWDRERLQISGRRKTPHLDLKWVILITRWRTDCRKCKSRRAHTASPTETCAAISWWRHGVVSERESYFGYILKMSAIGIADGLGISVRKKKRGMTPAAKWNCYIERRMELK